MIASNVDVSESNSESKNSNIFNMNIITPERMTEQLLDQILYRSVLENWMHLVSCICHPRFIKHLIEVS